MRNLFKSDTNEDAAFSEKKNPIKICEITPHTSKSFKLLVLGQTNCNQKH